MCILVGSGSPLRECGRPVEQYHSFVKVEDRSAVGISEILQNMLRMYNVRDKLIAQT